MNALLNILPGNINPEVEALLGSGKNSDSKETAVFDINALLGNVQGKANADSKIKGNILDFSGLVSNPESEPESEFVDQLLQQVNKKTKNTIILGRINNQNGNAILPEFGIGGKSVENEPQQLLQRLFAKYMSEANISGDHQKSDIEEIRDGMILKGDRNGRIEENISKGRPVLYDTPFDEISQKAEKGTNNWKVFENIPSHNNIPRATNSTKTSETIVDPQILAQNSDDKNTKHTHASKNSPERMIDNKPNGNTKANITIEPELYRHSEYESNKDINARMARLQKEVNIDQIKVSDSTIRGAKPVVQPETKAQVKDISKKSSTDNIKTALQGEGTLLKDKSNIPAKNESAGKMPESTNNPNSNTVRNENPDASIKESYGQNPEKENLQNIKSMAKESDKAFETVKENFESSNSKAQDSKAQLANIDSRSRTTTTSTQSKTAPVKFMMPENYDAKSLNHGKTVMVKLVPDHLGAMRLTLSSHHDIITGRIIVDKAAALHAIESNLDNLADSLAEKGIKLDTFQVSVGGNSEQNAAWNKSQESNRAHAHNMNKEKYTKEDDRTPKQTKGRGIGQYVHAGGVNLLA